MRALGCAAAFDVVASVEGVVELLAIDGDVVAQTGGEEDSRRWLRSSRVVPVALPVRFCAGSAGVVGQPMSVADFGCIREDGRLHDLEVLLILSGGAGGNFVEPLAGVRFIDAVEAVEGGEELIVAADASAGDEAAHGEGVDEGIVEFLILEGVFGADVALATDWLRRNASRGGLGFEETHGLGIDAEDIGGGIFDEGFGVDGAGEVHVEVCALWACA